MAASTSTSAATTTTSTMNRKTALASAAGTTQPQKHRPTSLRTPITGTYPSTINSPSTSFTSSSFYNTPPTPVSGVPDHHQKSSDIPPASATSFSSRTPLTPPPAYLDFLKAVSPSILPSPLSTGTSVHFSFSGTTSSAKSPGIAVPRSANLSGRWTGREKWPNHYSSRPVPTSASGAHMVRHGRSTSLSQRPVLSSHVSEESTVSTFSSVSSTESMESMESDLSNSSVPSGVEGAVRPVAGTSGSSGTQTRSISDSQIPTTTSTFAIPEAKPSSNTTPPRPTTTRPPGPLRRPSIIIPPSPSTSSPVPLSASELRSASSLRDSAMSSANTTPTKTPRTVSVRQVVTKTVTYNRPHSNSVTYTRTAGSRDGGDAERGGGRVDAAAGRERALVKVEEGRRDDDEGRASRHGTPKPLVGEAPRGKRRKVD